MTPARGRRLLDNRYLNKGTAFSDAERSALGLHGLLPTAVEDITCQLERARTHYDEAPDALAKHLYLRELQESNSVLFYRFLTDHLAELLPIVYTPTVGTACQEWSRTYRREHGLYLSWPDRHRVDELLENALDDLSEGAGVDVVVATDGERILGLGDLGIGGMGIPIGKLALYTAVGRVDPSRTLPVVLDVGTDNEALLSDPLYLGWRHRRVRDDQYDELVDAFVDALGRHCPGVLLQWEDFAQRNADRLLERHRHRILSFNDDIQGTAAVSVAAVLAGARATGVAVADLRIAIVGAGSAGVGIARQLVSVLVGEGLSPAQARSRCWLVDREGLVHERLDDVRDAVAPFARTWDEVAPVADDRGHVDLTATVQLAAPHVLVGVTGQPGLFTEEAVRAMAARVDRPVLLPLSNPTPRAEGIPADLLAWTDGRAVIGTGSPFAPVHHGGVVHPITQVNNLYVFPGLGRGVVAVRAREVTDAMLDAAAHAIAARTPVVTDGPVALLPPIDQAGDVADEVALAVAHQAVRDGVADPLDDRQVREAVAAVRWTPVYRTAT